MEKPLARVQRFPRLPAGVPSTWRVGLRVLLVSLVLFAVAGAADARRVRAGWISGRIVAVHDGDTATLKRTDGARIKLRFYGVDAPELATRDWPEQAYARDAARFMQGLLLEQDVSVRLTGDQTYGRLVGEIFVDGHSAPRELLRAGYGWWNERYAARDSDLERLQRTAKATRRGLWGAVNPEPPWRFRARHRER